MGLKESWMKFDAGFQKFLGKKKKIFIIIEILCDISFSMLNITWTNLHQWTNVLIFNMRLYEVQAFLPLTNKNELTVKFLEVEMHMMQTDP